jgi:hypothetical protein
VRLSCGEDGVVEVGRWLVGRRELLSDSPAGNHSRGSSGDDSMPRIVPSGSRSIVGA